MWGKTYQLFKIVFNMAKYSREISEVSWENTRTGSLGIISKTNMTSSQYNSCSHGLLFLQVKLRLDVKNVNTTCSDLDFLFSFKDDNGCEKIKSCINENTTRKKLACIQLLK